MGAGRPWQALSPGAATACSCSKLRPIISTQRSIRIGGVSSSPCCSRPLACWAMKCSFCASVGASLGRSSEGGASEPAAVHSVELRRSIGSRGRAISTKCESAANWACATSAGLKTRPSPARARHSPSAIICMRTEPDSTRPTSRWSLPAVWRFCERTLSTKLLRDSVRNSCGAALSALARAACTSPSCRRGARSRPQDAISRCAMGARALRSAM